MKTVKVFIEIASFGYSAYMDDNDLPYGIIGEGKTVEETISDFMVGYDEMKRLFDSEGGTVRCKRQKVYQDSGQVLLFRSRIAKCPAWIQTVGRDASDGKCSLQ